MKNFFLREIFTKLRFAPEKPLTNPRERVKIAMSDEKRAEVCFFVRRRDDK